MLNLAGLIVPDAAHVINNFVRPFRKRDCFESIVIDKRNEHIAFQQGCIDIDQTCSCTIKLFRQDRRIWLYDLNSLAKALGDLWRCPVVLDLVVVWQ